MLYFYSKAYIEFTPPTERAADPPSGRGGSSHSNLGAPAGFRTARMVVDEARDRRVSRVRRPPHRPGEATRPSSSPRTTPRPTTDVIHRRRTPARVERREAELIVEAMRTLGLLKLRSSRVKPNLIALGSRAARDRVASAGRLAGRPRRRGLPRALWRQVRRQYGLAKCLGA